MTVQQFQQIVAQNAQKAQQQQQQQVLQQIISTVGTQPVGTSAGTTVTVGGTQIITSALQQQQPQQNANLGPTRIVSPSVAATLLAQQQAQQGGAATVVASLSGATSLAGLQKTGQLQTVQATQGALNPGLTQQVIAVGKPGATLRPIFTPTAHLQQPQQRQTVVGQPATLTGAVVAGGGATVLQTPQHQPQRPVVVQTAAVNQGVPVSIATIQNQQLFQARLATQISQTNVKQPATAPPQPPPQPPQPTQSQPSQSQGSQQSQPQTAQQQPSQE